MTIDQELKAKWVLTQALEFYDTGECLHWATDARKLLAEIDGNTIVKEADCGCIVARSQDGLYFILGQKEGLRNNPLAGQFGEGDEVMARVVLREFCPHEG